MKVLLDQGVPVPLRTAMPEIDIRTALFMGWSELSNGALLDAAEREVFTVLVTTDRNLQHQQKLDGRAIAVVILPTTSWPRLSGALPAIRKAIEGAQGGRVLTVSLD
jgi:hypothetical protein